jgi:cell division protein FtsX
MKTLYIILAILILIIIVGGCILYYLNLQHLAKWNDAPEIEIDKPRVNYERPRRNKKSK